MKDEIADLVYPVVKHALDLRERLEKGELLDIDVEQAELKRLLRSKREAQRWPEFGGDDATGGPCLGIRYALTCWLDELFLRDSPWEKVWTERRLEAALYGCSDGARRFWEQASKAEALPSTDGIEAFFLCVMLGFRGDRIGAPEKLQEWVGARARLARNRDADWETPSELEMATAVPPLKARGQLQRMVLAGSVTLMLVIPIVVFFVARQVGH